MPLHEVRPSTSHILHARRLWLPLDTAGILDFLFSCISWFLLAGKKFLTMSDCCCPWAPQAFCCLVVFFLRIYALSVVAQWRTSVLHLCQGYYFCAIPQCHFVSFNVAPMRFCPRLSCLLLFVSTLIVHVAFWLLPFRLVFPHFCCAATHHFSLFLQVSHVVPRLAGISFFFTCLSWRGALEAVARHIPLPRE